VSTWFTNKGQIIQVVLTAVACTFAGINAWPKMSTNQLFSVGSILFYFLIVLTIVAVGRLVYTLQSSKNNPSLPPTEYPTEKRNVLRELILLREVYIHMILTRPVDATNQDQVEKLNQNFAWWEAEVTNRLPRVGASSGQISSFKALGNLATGNIRAEKLERLNVIIDRVEEQ